MLLDNRCPRCNRPVQGKEDVLILKSKPAKPATRCQNCKCPITLTRSEWKRDAAEPEFYYTDDSAGENQAGKLSKTQILMLSRQLAQTDVIHSGRDAAYYLCGVFQQMGFDAPTTEEITAYLEG